MINILPYEPSEFYCPLCGDFTNSMLEPAINDLDEDILICNFCGYETEEEED